MGKGGILSSAERVELDRTPTKEKRNKRSTRWRRLGVVATDSYKVIRQAAGTRFVVDHSSIFGEKLAIVKTIQRVRCRRYEGRHEKQCERIVVETFRNTGGG
ncbi:hypothetical protein KPH14_011768 [Odynerus spinipes]|uniref:Uncharacterized protein n=1 Tax=Odynerus spinipes TaxID=1348599 RepID=A0AAD9RWG5_9HYME|nr:hypothetical protein KPH14_011768 [Odynerus spinipes]